jgi:hypothetical protein
LLSLGIESQWIEEILKINIMKKITLSLVMITATLAAFSQEREYRTVFDNKELRISGMGGPFMQFTSMAGEFAHMMGGGGAVMLNDFFFGGYGLGLTNAIPDRINEYDTDDRLSMGHGGFWIGYTLFGERPIHASFSSLIGWGEFGIMQQGSYYPYIRDNIFVLAPTVELEVNLTRYFRIGVGASYNLYAMVDGSHNYRSQDLSSPGGFLSFKFGWF